ncbi:MAG: hypothetical protein ACRDXB_03760, partial [Actinomycetes bacterium]
PPGTTNPTHNPHPTHSPPGRRFGNSLDSARERAGLSIMAGRAARSYGRSHGGTLDQLAEVARLLGEPVGDLQDGCA